ncbi:hypothetical protein TNCV_3998611 [Trichonephila clavipes]|nr:hypothetical protein TNCV_3998611 [Trichonephila clavipes]
MLERHHLSGYDRGRAVGRLEADQSVNTVAAAMGRSTTPLEDHYVALVGKKDRNVNPGRIVANLATATDTHVSAKTFSNKSSWFVCMEACSLQPTSTTPSSREITLMVCMSSPSVMDDNTRPHRNVEVSDTLQSENILRMQWPAYSPDLILIEHVYDALGRRIAQRTILSVQRKSSKPP